MAISNRRRFLFHKQKGKCYYCERQMTLHGDGPLSCTVEHKYPLSLGGTGKMKNLAGACLQCNNLKGSMTERQFRDFMKSHVFQDSLEIYHNRRHEIRMARKAKNREMTAGASASRKRKMPKPPYTPYVHPIYCSSVETVFSDVLAEYRGDEPVFDDEVLAAADAQIVARLTAKGISG